MKYKLLIFCLLFIRGLLAHEGGSFADNQLRFIVQHLPKLLEENSEKVLLLGSSDLIYSDLCKLYPSIKFEELSIWDKDWWDETIEKRNWNGIFDCVVAIHLLEREPNRGKILQMISDLLRPRGKVLMYLDPQEEKKTFDQRVERHIRSSMLSKTIPITPCLSISEYQKLIENTKFCILDQSPTEYKIYFKSDFSAFWSVLHFVCPRWQVPRTEWDEEAFSIEIKGCLKSQWEVMKVPNECPIFNSWIEDTLPTYYFILMK